MKELRRFIKEIERINYKIKTILQPEDDKQSNIMYLLMLEFHISEAHFGIFE